MPGIQLHRASQNAQLNGLPASPGTGTSQADLVAQTSKLTLNDASKTFATPSRWRFLTQQWPKAFPCQTDLLNKVRSPEAREPGARQMYLATDEAGQISCESLAVQTLA